MSKLHAKERDELKTDQFAVPGKRKLPIHDATHIREAWDMVDRTKGLSSSERTTARRRILAAAKEHGLDTSDWAKSDMTDRVTAPVEVLTDAAAEGPVRGRFLGAVANVVNDNLRLYPHSVLADAVERLKKRLPVVGEMPHPRAIRDKRGRVQFESDPSNGALMITNAFMDGPKVYFDAEVLETTRGRDVKVYIDRKLPVGVSIRMIGDSVQRSIDGVMVDVATHLDIYAWDVVGNPATEGCGLEQVLTDSQIDQLIEDGIEEAIEDATQVASVCPHCGGRLQSMDPDSDGDVDFLACPPCGAAYILSASTRQETSHTQTLSRVTPDNWDGYGLAREWVEKNGKSMTDSVKNEGTDIMDAIALAKTMKEDQSVRAVMAESAKEIALEVAKPALDAVEAQKQVDAKAQAKADAKAFLDEKLASLKETYEEKQLAVIRDSIGEPETREQAAAAFASALKFAVRVGAKAFTDAVGFDPSNANQQGRVRVDVTRNERPWVPIVDNICQALDDYGRQYGHEVDPSLRAYNRKQVLERKSTDPSCSGLTLLDRIEETLECRTPDGKVLRGAQALADSARAFTDSAQGGEVVADAITTTNLLNQPTILTAILVQSYQDCEALQFVFTDIFKGDEARQPVETPSYVDAWDGISFLQDIFVGEGVGISPAQVNLTWQSYSPRWRKTAVELTKEAMRQLQSGPANYPALARALYHITQNKMRKIDNALYLEQLMISDEYAPLTVTAETPDAANKVTATGLPAGSNAAYLYKLEPATPDYQAPSISAAGVATGGNPVLRPRAVTQHNADGTVTTTVSNAFACSVSGSPIVQGAWDGTNIQDIPGAGTAQFAVDYEHGIVYFKATGVSGVNPGAATPVLPTMDYKASTNYDRWSSTVPDGIEAAVHYNTLLNQLSGTAARMGSSPRFKKPNIAIMSLVAATYIENAQIFYKLAQPDGTRFLPTGNTFGERAGMNLSRINAPWAAGDGRILCSQKGSTRYLIETPFEIEGPYPKYDASRNIVDNKIWYGAENSAICTPVVKDTNGNQQNPPSRTIIIG
jgi:hypothetical protein